jgi:hypothetical protein
MDVRIYLIIHLSVHLCICVYVFNHFVIGMFIDISMYINC